jgi:hypothetical protein
VDQLPTPPQTTEPAVLRRAGNDAGEPIRNPSGAATSTDPALSHVITVWSSLPEPIRRAVLALVAAASPAGG